MISGFALIDKPQGWTSHDVVGRLRRLYGQRRVGHAGTLDPMATGVLVVGLGHATRLLRFVQGQPKTYEATIRLGAGTLTDDAEGEVVATPGWEWDPAGLFIFRFGWEDGRCAVTWLPVPHDLLVAFPGPVH